MMDKIVYDRLDDLLSAIEYNGGGISELLGKGCVKSVQRGFRNNIILKGTDAQNVTIPITTVDISKSVLYLNYADSSSTNNNYGSISLTSNGIVFSKDAPPSGYTSTVSWYQILWQVIEFY